MNRPSAGAGFILAVTAVVVAACGSTTSGNTGAGRVTGATMSASPPTGCTVHLVDNDDQPHDVITRDSGFCDKVVSFGGHYELSGHDLTVTYKVSATVVSNVPWLLRDCQVMLKPTDGQPPYRINVYGENDCAIYTPNALIGTDHTGTLTTTII